MLRLQFGVSVFGVVVTVAAFMLGLAGGSFLMAARAQRCPRPLRLLALLEAAIAVFALLLPWGVRSRRRDRCSGGSSWRRNGARCSRRRRCCC
jgi:hypothetical protein